MERESLDDQVIAELRESISDLRCKLYDCNNTLSKTQRVYVNTIEYAEAIDKLQYRQALVIRTLARLIKESEKIKVIGETEERTIRDRAKKLWHRLRGGKKEGK